MAVFSDQPEARMASHPTKPISYWLDSTPETHYPALPGDLDVDVAIVGGGIVGLTTALLLKRGGRSVAVLESRKIAAQVTGATTAKLTSLHGLIYADLIKHFGEDRARLYAESNQAAIQIVETLKNQLGVECDFERKAAYTVAESTEQVPALKAEVKAALKLGLPASFVTETSLPFPVAGAVRFDGQAQFHPRKYLLAVAGAVDGAGSMVFENTRVLDVDDGNPCRVLTDQGTVSARHVIVATNLPILDRGGFFAKAFPKRHMILGIRVVPEQVPDGMFLGVGRLPFSVRVQPTEFGPLLIVSGEGFPTGHGDAEAKLRELHEFVHGHFMVTSIDYQWGNHDYYAVDRVPYIGRLTSASTNLYTATGFSAWGLTNGTVAATILSDEVLGNHNPWAEVYRATRTGLTTGGGAESVSQNLHVGGMWVKEKLFSGAGKSVDDLIPGEGEVISRQGNKIAAYRDEQGRIHAVAAVCTHMGCIVHWNAVERSWDCPCHGSRFDIDGKVLSGPTVKDLDVVSME
jgi:glycine/D-amino acid oxidase-like deaminating enzyme/nitrite reductase/ring-hydroxylating ferredoxin subunit